MAIRVVDRDESVPAGDDGWTWTHRQIGRPGETRTILEHRRQVGVFELLVENDPSESDITWLINCEGSAVVIGEVSGRRKGPIHWLVREAKRKAEEAIGLRAIADPDMPRAAIATADRLHPDDIEAIATSVAAILSKR